VCVCVFYLCFIYVLFTYVFLCISFCSMIVLLLFL
jgi:hypothetical protein